MAVNKILVRTSDPAGYGGEWAAFQQDSTAGGIKATCADAVIPVRSLDWIVKVPLAGATIHAATGGVVAWVNPHSTSIMIKRVIIDITTVATGACTLDVGYTVTSALTTSDTFLDGIDANAAVAVFDSMDPALDSGANAHAQKAATGKWVTIDEKTGDATGLVANLYIHYGVI